ncbi:hypothetical protein [Microbacterium dextranolyticum]|uniref:Uncharacterized protein n=1 Tax=Microbacterium dextranolyticum TaxID=36806 RepID=A0A9W6HMP7_9MICO|nr:hypothetical protein [Microbacterium dextranolyticum]MBM7463228.1 hypothetical protein [Microbacterium dextranolyticum]GLJ95667.1 hypothetical protein GCM10017591_17300 [Microbacterium dextranolyticum]
MSHSPTFGVSADFTPAPLPPENLARLRALLFAPDSDTAADDDPPTCGLDAAFDRIDAHLAQFQADAEAQARPALLLVGGGR